MKPYALIIVGALAASVVWMFVIVWLLDLRTAAERRAAAWQAECCRLLGHAPGRLMRSA